MGKKSRHKKTNNGGPPRKGLAAADVPTAVAAAPEPTIYETISRLFHTDKYDEILKVESKYRHLETFSDDPDEDMLVLHAFGYAHRESFEEQACSNRAIDYFERAKERIDAANANDQVRFMPIKTIIGMALTLLYSDGRDMEKAISSHRWFLANCNDCDEVIANHLINIGRNFNRFERFEYTIEVLEGFADTMKTSEEEIQAEVCLVDAYIGCGEFLKAKATKKNCLVSNVQHWMTAFEYGSIEKGLCNYEAALAHYRIGIRVRVKEEYDPSHDLRDYSPSVVATTLLQHTTAYEAEAFAIFQEELDRFRDPHRSDPLRCEEILFQMGTWYRKLNKWDQSIEALHQLHLSATRADGTMLLRANEAMAQTYLEQYCTDTNLDINQRTEILSHAKMYSLQVHIVSTEMHLTQAQLFYFNGDKQQSYRHLELYLEARLAECKLSCYTCQQRVRHGSVPFSCASCKVASYCGRKHQKLTWKNERICHKVLCPLFGYWRRTKKERKRRDRNGRGNEDQSESVKVFQAFFESICPHIEADSNRL
jgi:hypothetical protein